MRAERGPKRTRLLSYRLSTVTADHFTNIASVVIISLFAAMLTSSNLARSPIEGGSFFIWLLKRLSSVRFGGRLDGSSLILLANSSSFCDQQTRVALCV